MESEQLKLTAAYVPFATFTNALDHLKAIGVPNTIDRRVFPSFAGIIQGQIISAFKFLGLIDEHGKPTSDLIPLTDGRDRKAPLRELLKKRYPALISLDLTKTSPSQFDKVLGEYGATGATQQKAKTFFLKAAQFAELPLSPLLTHKTRSSVGGTRRRKAVNDQNENKIRNLAGINTGTSKTILLKSGGELTFSLSMNLFDLIGKDREFVFGIIDKIQTYEKEPVTK